MISLGVGEGCAGKWRTLALPQTLSALVSPLWMMTLSPTEMTLTSTAGSTLSSISSSAQGSWCCTCLVCCSLAAPERAGEAALGCLPENLHTRNQHPKSSSSPQFIHQASIFYFFGQPLLIYSCGNACFPHVPQFPQTPRVQRFCVSKPPATTNGAGCDELHGCLASCGCGGMGFTAPAWLGSSEWELALPAGKVEATDCRSPWQDNY